jgi:hypothetical protein
MAAVAAMIGTGAIDFRNLRGLRASFSGTPLTWGIALLCSEISQYAREFRRLPSS